ncbi:unnamed protein product, partial [Meganyctiphanes norvegica]
MVNSTNNSSGKSWLSPPADVEPALRIRNQIILPIFITFGVIANTFTFYVVTRPKPRTLYFNLYIQVMSLLDLLGFIMRLPIAFDDEYCGYSQYSMAFYMTHFGWLIINMLRGINSYVLVFLSLDRFIGIWWPDTFRNMKDSKIGTILLILTSVLVFFTTYIPWTTRFLKVSPDEQQWFMNWKNPDQPKSMAFRFFRHYSTLIITVLPSILIAGLNIGIVIGFFKKNIYGKESIGSSKQTAKTQRFYHTIAVLLLNASYAICCFPYAVVSIYIETGTCYSKSTYGEVTMLYLLESLSSLWSILNMLIFFLLTKEYISELKKMFKTLPLFKNYITESTQASHYINDSVLNCDP